MTIAPLPLHIRIKEGYIKTVTSVAMAINAVWNKRIGPGGGARRLHHQKPEIRSQKSEEVLLISDFWLQTSGSGADSGSTDVVKGTVFARHDSAAMGHFLSANDNVALVAANDNAFVAVKAAA